ncbi:transposable element Tcb1 transposase [Trichonephila clavipes]|nr:transposable element Tcb1 transposase [Trichonephila clavipes]
MITRVPQVLISRRIQRSAFDQVSEFDRGRIVAYRDCGLSFREIGSRVGRNQTTVIGIVIVGCRRVRRTDVVDHIHLSAPLHCLRVPFSDVYSRVVCPQDVHDLVYPRRRTTDVSTANGAMKEGCGGQNVMKLSLLTNHASVCNTTMFGRVWRHHGERMLNNCVMHRHTGPAPGIGYHSRTPLVRITGTLNSQHYISEVLESVNLPYFQGLAKAIFQPDNARPHVSCIVQSFFVNHQIELLTWPARSPDLSPIETCDP